MDTFDSGSATGGIRDSTPPVTWIGNVTQNSTSITVGGNARDDNGWGADHLSIDASAMTYVRITGRLEAGNVASTVGVALAGEELYPDIFSVSTSVFVTDAWTQVQIPILAWINVSNPGAINEWSIGGATTGLVAFRMSFEDLALSSDLVSLSGGGRIVTAGDQVYTNAITLDAATWLGSTGSNGNAITFNTTIDGAHSLTLDSPGTKTFAGAVGAVTALASVETNASGATAINGGQVITSGDQTYNGAVTLGADTLLHSTNGGVNLLGEVTGNGHVLTLEVAQASLFLRASDLAGWIKSGSGMLTATGQSSFEGGITIGEGTLALGLDQAFLSENALTLSGGVLAMAGYDQTFGTLTLNGSAGIDFGSGGSSLFFAESQTIDWTGTLSIENFTNGVDSLRFGTSIGAITHSQLSRINFGAGLAAVIDANGFVTSVSAVPEPAAGAVLCGLVVLAGAFTRRRCRAFGVLT